MNKVLWLTLGGSAQAWYRCAVPATSLGYDWAGYIQNPPDKGGIMIAGNLLDVPNLDDYDIIIIQMMMGKEWVDFVKRMKAKGKKVLYECDDYIHGVYRIKDHVYRSAYAPKRVKLYTMVMEACDGIICSTQYLADQYSKYNKTYVALNSIYTDLYDVKEPDREGQRLVLGWSGGTGHMQSFKSWYREILEVMTELNDVNLVTIGSEFANEALHLFPDRCLSVPWTPIENYPYAIRAFDISLAPSHDSKFFRSKSDLRWIEAGAAGIPSIVNPITYPFVKDGENGLVAETPSEFKEKLTDLILDKELRETISKNVKKEIRDTRDISVGQNQWLEIFNSLEN